MYFKQVCVAPAIHAGFTGHELRAIHVGRAERARETIHVTCPIANEIQFMRSHQSTYDDQFMHLIQSASQAQFMPDR